MRAASVGILSAGVLSLLSLQALAHNDHGHSLEADQHDRRAEGPQARAKATHRIRWRDPSWKRDPIVSVKLLGINDFHGQLSARTVGARPAGGAAVLASYLRTESAEASGDAFIIHAGDHVGASPPNSALLQDEPAISVLNLLANKHCLPFKLQRRLPDWLEPYSQLRCNVVGTLGNHEFDEGAGELLRLVAGGDHSAGPFLEPHWQGARFPYVSANVLSASNGKPCSRPTPSSSSKAVSASASSAQY